MSEYEMLREEIMHTFDHITTYNCLVYTVTATIIAFIWKSSDFVLCLLPLLVIIPVYLIVQDDDDSICYIAAYMTVFLEGDSFNWEHRHHYFDSIFGSKRPRKYGTKKSYLLLVSICCILSLYKLIMNYGLNIDVVAYYLLIFVCWILSIYIIETRKLDHVERRQLYIRKWKEVKKTYDGNRTRTKRTGTP